MGGVDDRDPGDELDKIVVRAALVKALGRLTAREENIIRLRFGLVEQDTDHANFPITKKQYKALKKQRSSR